MPPAATPYATTEDAITVATRTFWSTYYDALLIQHLATGKAATEPVRDRNKLTTNAAHIRVYESYWGDELAAALGVARSEVGPRRLEFRPYRGKSIDVCYPRVGDPKILISIKSMQNAYRNMTNRIEEALGDSAIVRLYDVPASYGFFFFVLDGLVARGRGEPGVAQGKSIPPYLNLVQDGGDFFDVANIAAYRRPPGRRPRQPSSEGRQDEIERAAQSLLDLVEPNPSQRPTIKYDAIAFLPTTLGLGDLVGASRTWNTGFSAVNPLLEYKTFVQRLVDVARLRGLVN